MKIINKLLGKNKRMTHTNISINVITKARLKRLGGTGDSFDKVINKLAQYWEEGH